MKKIAKLPLNDKNISKILGKNHEGSSEIEIFMLVKKEEKIK